MKKKIKKWIGILSACTIVVTSLVPAQIPALAAENSEVTSTLDFDLTKNPADIMVEGFGSGDSKYNIEGPEGSNCAVGSNWEDNGNLSVVNAINETNSGASATAAVSLNNTAVFKFFLHDNKDWDRNTSIVDRQRIEIKTEAKNDDVNSRHGDILTNQWKFFLPADTPLPNEASFFHIFQTKATQGDESSMPVFTFSVTDTELFFHGSNRGHVNQDIQTIASTDITNVLGKWMEAEVTTYTAEKGYVYVKLQDISNPSNPVVLMDEGYNIDTWRRNEKLMETGLYEEHDEPALAAQINRSKWGLYRKNDSPVPFGEATMYLADVSIIKRDAETYLFPDGFDPKTRTKDISWLLKPETLEVLTGTEFNHIYLTSTVDAYIECHNKQAIPVTWAKGEYNKNQTGTYTIYGTLTPPGGITNPNRITASMQIKVVDTYSNPRVNWALGTDVGGTASIKSIGGSATNPAEYLIDGDDDTTWATHSGLVQTGTEDNLGYRYWAAIDLGEERTYDEVRYALGTIGSSKQFRLKNYSIYYTNTALAYNEIVTGTTGSPVANSNITKNPLLTPNGGAWIKIPNVEKSNQREDGIKEVTNNINHTYELNTPVTSRYVLLLGKIENVDATAGAIHTKTLELIGDKELAEIHEITAVAPIGPFTAAPGTALEDVGLPSKALVTLSDNSQGEAVIKWNSSGYQKNTESSYNIEGILSFPADKMRNPEALKAQTVVKVSTGTTSGESINWATVEKGASVKTVSNTTSNIGNNFIDGTQDTIWSTHSSLITTPQAVYWAAIDLGEARNIQNIGIAWDTTGSRLKNYAVYYSMEDAYSELIEGGTNPAAATPDPLLTENGSRWIKLNELESLSVVANNTTVDKALDQAITARYLLLRCEIDDSKTAGAVNAKLFCAKSYQVPDISQVYDAGEITVNYGTPFGEINFPKTVRVKLDNNTEADVMVNWLRDGYDKTSEGTIRISGTLLPFQNEMSNNGSRSASIVVKINKSGSEDNFVAVTDITGVTSTVEAGISINLSGIISPLNATNKTILWSVKDAGTTGSVIKNNVLSAKAEGTLIVTASVENGTAGGKEFTKNFTIKVIKKAAVVKSVSVSPASATVIQGKSKVFAAKVAGTSSPPQSVNWQVKGNKSSKTKISSSGRLTVGSDESASTLSISATSKADTKKTATVKVKVAGRKGSVFSSGSYQYKITNENTTGKGTVSVQGLAKKKSVTSVTVPKTIKNNGIVYKVTAVGSKAFYKNNKIKTVNIGNNVTLIGKNAFSQCSKLTKVILGNKVTTISDYGFSKCKNLQTVSIGTGLKKLGNGVFSDNAKLKSLMITSKKLVTVGKSNLKNVRNLKIKVPSSKVKSYKRLFSAQGQKKNVVVTK